MKILEVKDRKTAKEFLEFHKNHYKDDPQWICPLDKEFNSVFNPDTNNTFRHGRLRRWILKNENGTIIGRIAAFIDDLRLKAYKQATGGLGFFEVIEDWEAAKLLFDTAVDWLKKEGMEAVDGPITFGSNETNWGLLVEGYSQPTYGMQYHKKYYKGYFEKYGFLNYYEQYSYIRDIASVEVFPERFMKIAEWIHKKPGYEFRHLEINKIRSYIEDLVEVYNTTWSEFREDYEPLNTDEFYKTFKKSKAFVDEELIWFAYKDGKPIAFFVLFPDLNLILKHFNGRLNLWNTMRFLYLKKRNTMTRMRALVAGVVPAYQNSGVESAIFLCLYHVFMKKRFYTELELSWVGDFNKKMMSIYSAIGASKSKTHITYRYMINKNLPFTRLKDEMAELVNDKN